MCPHTVRYDAKLTVLLYIKQKRIAGDITTFQIRSKLIRHGRERGSFISLARLLSQNIIIIIQNVWRTDNKLGFNMRNRLENVESRLSRRFHE